MKRISFLANISLQVEARTFLKIFFLVVISHGKEKTAVFTRYFDKLYNPPTNADREHSRPNHGTMEFNTGILSRKK